MIDRKKLPQCALIDSGVYMLAMGDRPKDERAPMCREFVDSMLLERRQLLISALTLTEYLRGQPAKPPLQRGVQVVAFDDRCSRFLGNSFREAPFNDLSKQSGFPVGYFQYDALIIACAKVWGADHLVTLAGTEDENSLKKMGRLAELAGVSAKHPRFYQEEVPYLLRRADSGLALGDPNGTATNPDAAPPFKEG